MDYYRRKALSFDFGTRHRESPTPDEAPDEIYLEKMQNILSASPCIGVPPEPSNIIANVYLGSTGNAENLSMIKAMRLTYILNCAGTGSVYGIKRVQDLYSPDTGVMGYQELRLEDTEGANIRGHLERAHAFIDYAQDRNARVLVYSPGVSRGAAVVLSYMLRRGRLLLDATRHIKDMRRCVLTNDSFMRQLVQYARELRCLDPDVESVRAPSYFRKINKYRMNSAHLPTFL